MSFQCPDQRVRVKLVDSGTTLPTVEQGCRVDLSSDAQRSSADITKLAECYIPLEWNNQNIVEKVSAFDPANQSSYDLVDIEFQNVRSGEWTTVMRGFVRGISGTQQTGVARMIVSSPDTLLSAVPYSARYERPNVRKVFEDVLNEFNENTPFEAELSGVPSRNVEESQDFIESTLSTISFGFSDVLTDTVLPDVAAFKRNRHSLSDVLSWATEISGHKYYFEVSEGGQLQLVYDDGSDVTTFTQRQNRGSPKEQTLNEGGSFPNASDGQIDVISNTALAEIYPVNTLHLKGATGVSVLGHDVAFIPSREAPFITVQYTPLVESAGGNVVGKTITTKNTTVKSATNTAKRKLEQMILNSGTGEITAYGNPKPKPYDRCAARPECSDVLTFDAPVLPYQIGSVIHEKAATKEHGPLEYRTTLKTTPVVDPSKIEVKSAEMRKV